jgi:hypothetical protein
MTRDLILDTALSQLDLESFDLISNEFDLLSSDKIACLSILLSPNPIT